VAPTAAWVVAQPLTSEWTGGGTTNTQRKNRISEGTIEVAST
jgi:hypothetical protein